MLSPGGTAHCRQRLHPQAKAFGCWTGEWRMKKPWRPFKFNLSFFGVRPSSSSSSAACWPVAASASSSSPAPHHLSHLSLLLPTFLISIPIGRGVPSTLCLLHDVFSFKSLVVILKLVSMPSTDPSLERKPELGAGRGRPLELMGSRTQEQGKDGSGEQPWWEGLKPIKCLHTFLVIVH